MRARRRWSIALVGLSSLALSCRGAGAGEEELAFPVALQFAGAERVDAETLEGVVRAELASQQIEELDRAAVDDAAFALELFYRALGHAEVRVEYELVAEREPPLARFRIAEGPVVHVGALEVEGAAAPLPEEVRAELEPFSAGRVFDAQAFEAALDRIAASYRAAGHLRARVEADEPAYDEETATVALRVVLDEGPRFVLRALEIEGGIPEGAPLEAELAAKYVGESFVPAVAHEIEHALVAAYRATGYPDVTVEAEVERDETSGDTRIVATVVPGERVRIGAIRVEGNERTRTASIRAFLGLEPGDSYETERVNEAFRELYETGLFESVALELEGEGPERTLVVRVVEARSLQVRVEPGYGSYEGPRILLGVEEQNFLGRGQIVQVEGRASVRAQGARASWIDRDFLGSRFTSETTFFAEQREEPSFSFVRRGFGFFLRREWDDEWSSSSGYEFRPTDVTEEDVTADIAEDSDVAALSQGVTYDDRDNVLIPTRGQLGRVRLEWADDALGSDTEFVRTQLEYARLLLFGDGSVLAASLRTGVIAPYGITDEIPLSERFFNGGENTVRSFAEDELLPPGTGGDPQGGEAATTFNLEYRRGVWGHLGGALFFDAGNVTEEVQDYWRFEGFRVGLGLGVRYLLPIGPVRLDLGWNPNAREDDAKGIDEDDFVLHFSVGFPF